MPDSGWIWSPEHGDHYKAVYGPDGRVVRYEWGRTARANEPVETRLDEGSGDNGTYPQSRPPLMSSYSYYDTEPRASTSGSILPSSGHAPQAPPRFPVNGRNDEGKGIAGCTFSPSDYRSSGHSVPVRNAQSLPYGPQYSSRGPQSTTQYRASSGQYSTPSTPYSVPTTAYGVHLPEEHGASTPGGYQYTPTEQSQRSYFPYQR